MGMNNDTEKERMQNWDTLLKNFKIIAKTNDQLGAIIRELDAAKSEKEQKKVVKKFDNLLENTLKIDAKNVDAFIKSTYKKCNTQPDFAKAHTAFASLKNQYTTIAGKIDSTDKTFTKIITSTCALANKYLTKVDDKLSKR